MPQTLFDHPVLTSRYFFPLDEQPEMPWTVESHGERLLCMRTAAPNASHTLLHFHGNGETVSDYESRQGQDLAAQGVNVFFAEYRGYGGSTGEPGLTRCFDDVPALIRAAAPTPQQVVAFGRSLGSLYAIEAASTYPVAGLVIESGVAWPLERVLVRVDPTELGCTPETLRREADRWLNHAEKLARVNCPVLILHTVHDEIVAYRHAEALAEWLEPDQVTLVALPHGGHNDIMMRNRTAYLTALHRFLQRCGAVSAH